MLPYADIDTTDLIGMNVLAADGEDVGEIDNVATMGDRLMLVVGVGGFLGLGEQNVAIPLDRFAMEGDNLVITGLNSDQIENLPEYDEAQAEYASDRRPDRRSTTSDLGSRRRRGAAHRAAPLRLGRLGKDPVHHRTRFPRAVRPTLALRSYLFAQTGGGTCLGAMG